MTGRRLYDHYTDASRAKLGTSVWDAQLAQWVKVKPNLAWPYLGPETRAMWNELARRISPKPRRRSS